MLGIRASARKALTVSGITVGPAPAARVIPPMHVEAVDVALELMVDVAEGLSEMELLLENCRAASMGYAGEAAATATKRERRDVYMA